MACLARQSHSFCAPAVPEVAPASHPRHPAGIQPPPKCLHQQRARIQTALENIQMISLAVERRRLPGDDLQVPNKRKTRTSLAKVTFS